MTIMFDENILPQPLVATIAEFAQWVDSHIVEQSRADVVDSPVFHYTSRVGIEGILGGGFIRLTHLSDLADDQEFLYGRKLARDALSSSLASACRNVTATLPSAGNCAALTARTASSTAALIAAAA